MKPGLLVEIISAFLILLFVYTALSKLLGLDQFRDVLWQAPMIGRGAGIVARAVPLAELLIALLLFFPKYQGLEFNGLSESGLMV